jgi:two-component system, LytTR family, sensor histidine kinase AlgZ
MKDSQILSVFQVSTPAQLQAPHRAGARTLVFDVCQVGVILRAVLFVEALVAVAAMYSASTVGDWLAMVSLVTSGALTGTLGWLVAVCGLKTWLARLPQWGQFTAGMALGAVAGLYGCGLLALTGFIVPAPYVASAVTGALLSGLMVAGLVLRAKGQMPADITARLAELQARIRPHFLFNTLNSAIALVRAEPAKAEALLEDLADLFRHALAEPGESTTLAQEILLAQRYLAIEQVRFGTRLQLEWALDTAADTARLPHLLLQPLVENAVKHGVEPSPEGALLKISTERRGDRVVIKVSNTVPAGQGVPGQGLALANVRDRLSLLYDLHSRFEAGLRDSVFLVRIEIPGVSVKKAAL